MAKKQEKVLNSKTPQWFKDWHAYHYFPFRQEFKYYKWLQRAIFVALVAVAIGNFWRF